MKKAENIICLLNLIQIKIHHLPDLMLTNHLENLDYNRDFFKNFHLIMESSHLDLVCLNILLGDTVNMLTTNFKISEKKCVHLQKSMV